MQLQETITIIERITLSSGCLSNTGLRLTTQLQQHTAEHTSVEEIQSFSISLVLLSFIHLPQNLVTKPDFFLSFPNWNHVVGKSFVRRNSQCFSHPVNFITNAVHHITYSQACKSKTLTAQVYPMYRGDVAFVTCCEALGP